MLSLRRILGGAAIAVCLFLGASSAMAAKSSIKLGMVLEPTHLDPTAGAAAAIDEVVYANIFEGLTRIDRWGVVRPALAKIWKISKDKKTYTFFLREGVKFHDGSEFDADDVLFSLNRARGEGSTNAQKGLFKPIASVVKKDKYTVT